MALRIRAHRLLTPCSILGVAGGPKRFVMAAARSTSTPTTQQANPRGAEELDLRINALESLLADEQGLTEEERERLRLVASLRNMSQAEVTKWRSARLRDMYQRHGTDTGSPEVQIMAFSEHIRRMREHLRTNKKDLHTKKSLNTMLMKRRDQLLYLRRKNFPAYQRVVVDLGISEDEIFNVGKRPGLSYQKTRFRSTQ